MANGSKSFKSRSIGTNLTAGVLNTVYTCPANHTAKVELIIVANTTNGNKTITIKWHNENTGTEYFIVGGYVIPSYSFLKLADGYLVLNAGDYIQVLPEAGSVTDCTVSVEEYYDPMSRQ